MNEPCKVIIDGDDWYVPCDRVDSLALSDDGYLISVDNSSLTLYQSFSQSTSSSYPRISCNFGRACYLSTSNTQSVSYVRPSDFSVINRPLDSPINFLGLFVGLFISVVVLWLLK